MKAFQFRLDPARRWRATQLRLEREAVSQASRHLAALQAELNARHSELRTGAAELVPAGSAAFESWAAYVDRSRRRIRTLEDQLRLAKKELVLRTQRMVEAHRKLRALENLERDEHTRWAKDLGRETEALAGEAYLARLVRNSRASDNPGRRDAS